MAQGQDGTLRKIREYAKQASELQDDAMDSDAVSTETRLEQTVRELQARVQEQQAALATVPCPISGTEDRIHSNTVIDTVTVKSRVRRRCIRIRRPEAKAPATTGSHGCLQASNSHSDLSSISWLDTAGPPRSTQLSAERPRNQRSHHKCATAGHQDRHHPPSGKSQSS
jgi:hypothetical protein